MQEHRSHKLGFAAHTKRVGMDEEGVVKTSTTTFCSSGLGGVRVAVVQLPVREVQASSGVNFRNGGLELLYVREDNALTIDVRQS